MAGPLESAVREALTHVAAEKVDGGTVQLALTYAEEIDAGEDLKRLGPALLACLESMLMTPKARSAVVKGVKDDQPAKSPLDELRARRNARKYDATTVDAATG